MSNDISDDDLADNYGPTTPAPPQKKQTRPRPQPSTGRPVPGPSTKPFSKTRPNKAISIVVEDDDVAVVETTAPRTRKPSQDSDVVAVLGPATTKLRAPAKKAGLRPSPASNGSTATAAVKGKARATSPPKLNGISEEAMEVDEHSDVVEDEPPDPPAPRGGRGPGKQARGKSTVVGGSSATRQAKVDAKLVRENERLRAQLEQTQEDMKQVISQRDHLSTQLQDSFRIRHSEPERVLSDYKALYDEAMKKNDGLVQELTKRVDKLQQPVKSGSNSFNLQFITRETAEEEQKALYDSLNRLKDKMKQRDTVIAEKDQQISALQDEVKTIKRELNAEVERSKKLASRTPTNTTARSGNSLESSPILKLYEDMTNILVTGVKIEKSTEFPELDETNISCLYSYSNVDEKISYALNFSLRAQFARPDGYPPDEPITKEKLIDKIMFSPKNLDYENSELVERLQFFKEPFLFARNQLTVFLKTLTETVTNMFEDGPEGNDAEVITID